MNKSLLHRLPNFELSYETISHKKVSASSGYDVAIAIPMGRKYYAWFTFDKADDVCFLMEITRDKKIGTITLGNVPSTTALSMGTILYGTMVEIENRQVFVMEDVYYYRGISVKQQLFREKLGIYEDMLRSLPDGGGLAFALPMMWMYNENSIMDIPQDVSETCGYAIHHVQYRCLSKILPYVNLSTKMKTGENIPKSVPSTLFRQLPNLDYAKPQYKYPTVFVVAADVQFDIYHLYAYGQYKSQIYCGVAGIPTYKTSIFMNGLFRKIRENGNLDYIEESDDEDDFENVDFAKYVDTSKQLLIECVFHQKFKKWIPQRVVPTNSQIVHIHKLVR